MSRASRVAAKDLPVGTQRIRTSVWTYQSCRTRLFQSSAYFRSFHLVLRPFPKTTIRLYASFFCSHLSPSFRATTICVAFRKDGNTQKSPSDTIQKTSTLLNYHDLNVSRQNIPIALHFLACQTSHCKARTLSPSGETHSRRLPLLVFSILDRT